MKNKTNAVLLLLLIICSRAGATVTITGPNLPCVATSGITYTASDGGGGTWSSSNATRISINSTTGIAATGTLSGSLGPAVISYTPSGGGAVVTKSVTVSPVPDAIRIPTTGGTALAPAITLCVSANNHLISNYSTVSTWSSTNASVATISSTGVLEAVSAGSATISYVHENGCYVTSTVTVPPVLTGKSISGTGATPVVVCEGRTLQLGTDASAGGTWSSADMSIATIGTAGLMQAQTKTGTNIEYTTIQYMVSGSCVAQQATVNPRPESITGVNVMCLSTNAPLYDVVAGGTWSSSNATKATVNATTGVVTAVSAGTARITYTGGNSCFITRTQSVVATVSGSIAASSPYPSRSVCYGMTVPLAISGQTGGTWSSTDASVGTIDSTTGIATGSIYSTSNQTTFIEYINPSGCVSAVLTVNAVPPNITGTLAVCQGSATTLTNTSGGGTWGSSNTAVGTVGSSSGVLTGVAAGTTTITYTAATGCTTTAVVTVNSLPSAITGSSTVCAGSSTTYSSSGTGTWSSSNTGIASVNATTGVVTGNSAGAATISYTLSATGCFKTKTVTVNPSAGGTITGATGVCVGSTITLSDAAPGGTWSSSAPTTGSVSSSGVVSGLSAGTTIISYTATNDCGTSSATIVVTVNPPSTADSISGSTTIVLGDEVTLSDAMAGGTWSSSATSIATISATGLLTGVAGGTATITYAVMTGCATAYAKTTVTVTLPTITGWWTVCPGDTTYLGATRWGGTWSSADTTIATVNSSGWVIGVSPGTVTMSYTYHGILATTTVTVNPLASGTITGPSATCVGSTITLTNVGEGGGTWSSSSPAAGSVSSSGVVTGVSGGTTTISYAATGCGGTSSAIKVVTVNTTAPSPGTISGSTSLYVGDTVTLSDTVTGGAWSSSHTATATVSASGVVTGVYGGIATITYTVSNGCSAYATTAVSVNLPALSTPITGSLIVCPGATIYPGEASSGGVWFSADASIATVSGSAITGVSAGTVTLSYIYSGMLATATVTVHALACGTISGPTSVAADSVITLTDTSSGGTWSSSAPAIGSVSSSGVVTGISAGTTTISYTATGYCGTSTATYVVAVGTYCKIPMHASRWYQLNNTSNGLQGLFDGDLSSEVITGYGKILSNFDAYYPLLPGESMQIDSVRFYSGTGSSYSSAPFTLYYIDSAWNRVLIGTFIAGAYNQWQGPDPAHPSNFALPAPVANARYLLINCSSLYPKEMELYGTYVSPTPISAVPAKTITLGQEMGVNGFAWDFEDGGGNLVPEWLEAMHTFTGFRHYLDWSTLEPSEGGYTFNPSHNGSWNFDTLYSACQAKGILVLADIKTLPAYMQATYPTSVRDWENVPVRYGTDFSDPGSYIDQAKLAFQFAGRYGSNAELSSSLLSVDSSQRWDWTGDVRNKVKVGMGVVQYVECDNERDKWWKDRKAYQTGREYAANLSAFYDGNKHTMDTGIYTGVGIGVKNADPNMKVVMAGVALHTTDWLMGMIDWCKEYRGYNTDGSVNVCWDVINYHIYPFASGITTVCAAPEVAQADSVASRFVQVAHTYLKDMPVWVTETGYDINPLSEVRCIPIGSKTALQTQADWILRNSLLYARMGIEHVFFYMNYDLDSANPAAYSSSGLLTHNRTRKPAADYLYQANRLIGNYVFQQTIGTGPIVDKYTYDGDTVYVLVSPTQTGASLTYSLNIGTPGTVYIYTPTAGQDSMSLSTATATGTSVSLTVTETPIFVSATRLDQTAARPGKSITPPANIPASNLEAHVYPNPTTGNTTLSLNSTYAGDVQLTLSSETGIVYNTVTFSKATGAAEQSLEMKALPAGMYLLHIVQGNEQTVKKIIKLNR